MGYNTSFEGRLRLAPETTLGTAQHVRGLASRGGLFSAHDGQSYYLALRFDDEEQSLSWNGDEATYGMLEVLQTLSKELGLRFRPGDTMTAQGEEVTDRWLIVIDPQGMPTLVEATDTPSVCPHCGKAL